MTLNGCNPSKAAQVDAHVHWVLMVDVNDGKLDEFTAFANVMTKLVEKNEPNAFAYEFYLNEDKTKAVIYESYKDADAVMVCTCACVRTYPCNGVPCRRMALYKSG
jgi:hypothetical protein